jgi:hypothetical protein
MARDLLTLAVSFAVAATIAALAGAENLGTALAFGQIGFAIALLSLLLRTPRSSATAE